VVVRFDRGDPALLEAPLGQGRLLVLTAGWQPDDSQLAVSTKFVPLLWSLLELGGAVAAAPTQVFVGDRIPLPAAAEARTVRGPDGVGVALPAGAAEFAGTTQPGIYELAGGGRVQRWAVNLDANESRTAPLGPDELEHLGLPVRQPNVAAERLPPETAALLQAADAENRQKLWRWFVTATLAVLLVETALAGWTARRGAVQTQEVPS
jgi:hypothetical protein